MEYPIFSCSMFSSQLKLAGLAESRALRRRWFFEGWQSLAQTHAFHAIPYPQVLYVGLMFCQSIRAHQSLFCLTAESWPWTADFLLIVLATWFLISPPSSQCNRQLQIFFKAHKCHVAHGMINCSHHAGIFKEEKHSLEKMNAKQFLMWSDTAGNLQNIALDPKVRI